MRGEGDCLGDGLAKGEGDSSTGGANSNSGDESGVGSVGVGSAGSPANCNPGSRRTLQKKIPPIATNATIMAIISSSPNAAFCWELGSGGVELVIAIASPNSATRPSYSELGIGHLALGIGRTFLSLGSASFIAFPRLDNFALIRQDSSVRTARRVGESRDCRVSNRRSNRE